VRGDDDVVPQQLISRIDRLLPGHVQPGAGQVTALERGEQRVVVDDRAAAHVHQVAAGMHRGQRPRADHAARLLGQRHRHHEGRRPGQRGGEPRLGEVPLRREQGAQVLRELGVGPAADSQGRDAEGGQPGDEGRADRAGAEDGHRPSGQRVADRLADNPALHAVPQLRKVPEQEQQVHDRGLGDGDRVAGAAGGDVRDRDPVSPGGI
jgi:hypothetical protein